MKSFQFQWTIGFTMDADTLLVFILVQGQWPKNKKGASKIYFLETGGLILVH